jgi:hypothetical protein
MRATFFGLLAAKRTAYIVLDGSGNAILDADGKVLVVYI